METLHLIIGNKNYSSWSFRPWLAMRHSGIPFEETVMPLDVEGPDGVLNSAIKERSPSGRVPVLTHGEIVVWESLAILEYLNDIFPEKRLWPDFIGTRAVARAVCHEMHAGFMALRAECPMNMRRPKARLDVSEAVRADVARIEAIWRNCRARHGDTGPFLFGDFSIADAMYAPVVNRFDVYDLEVGEEARAYMETIKALPAYAEWAAAGAEEPWVIEADEV